MQEAKGFPMLWAKRKRTNIKRTAGALHSGMVMASLEPVLYERGLAIDTFEGRAAMVTAHASLLIPRLKVMENREGDRLAEAVNSLILDGFDASFREKGVGDSSIARKMRKLAEVHYGLGKSLAEAYSIENGARHAAVEACVLRNAICMPDKQTELADYMLAQRQWLAEQPDEAFVSGALIWPHPA
ncbi:ubiquinol-cytochrome C chaperone family protein [Hyphomonas pacifica]|nr:ubiquinol-cytochrome C chaperone family protein [Hyphomonas pacifica]